MRPIVVLILFLVFNPFLAVGTGRAAEPDIQPTLKIFRAPSESLLGKKLYVEFAGSPLLTSFLRNTLIDRGFQIVESSEAAEAQLRFQGTVTIGLFATNPNSAPLAEIIEKGALKVPTKDDATVGNTSIVNVVAMNQMARPFGVSFRNSVTLTGVLDWISDVTGLRGSFNKALTGDPRGICMHRDCDKYRQTVGIGTTGSATWIATALAMDEKVVLDKLIERTLEKALEPLQSK